MSEHRSQSRREFLKTLVVAAGTVGAAQIPLEALARHDGEDDVEGERARLFPQSVASGDPRPDSVVLWTRAADPARPGEDMELVLVVAADPWMRRREVVVTVPALAAHDGCVRVKVTGLKPRHTYHYRFFLRSGHRLAASPAGRTRTAPRPGDNASVKFALANCQDFIGRWYNSYLALLEEDLDFIVHVGDYIYETTGDPIFQQTSPERSIVFDDQSGAIALGSPASPYYAAASLDNYRQLHRSYRSDPVLQKLHERFPFIVTWDDHEYSDDCWGSTATYLDCRRDERDDPRRRNAERALFEYTPIDDGAGAGPLTVDESRLYPNNRLFRDFRFGRNLHLVMTDYRSFRPDHLVPEDAFPGAVPVDRSALTLLLAQQGVPYDAVKGSFAPYLDVDSPAFAAYKPVLIGVLTQAYAGAGLAPAEAAARAAATVAGRLDAVVVNSLLASYNAAVPPAAQVPPIPDAAIAAMDRGISFRLLGKASLFSSLGARYFVAKDTYDLYAAWKYFFVTGRDGENAYGAEQDAWVRDRLQGSDAVWKVLASSVSFTSLVLDLTGNLPDLPPPVQQALAALPAPLRNRFYLDADHWDGFPNFKREFLEFLGSVENSVIVSGDIHAGFHTAHAGATVEFTGPAVSSAAFRQGIANTIASDPLLSGIPGLDQLIGFLDPLLQAANPGIRYANTGVNGVVVIEAKRNRLDARYLQLDAAEALISGYDQPDAVRARTTETAFRIRPAR